MNLYGYMGNNPGSWVDPEGDERIPPKPGQAGGPDAGKRFTPNGREEVMCMNDGLCVYCGRPATQADHAVARALGGTRDPNLNGQPTCGWRNRSKGVGKYPKNPPPGFRGNWPWPKFLGPLAIIQMGEHAFTGSDQREFEEIQRTVYCARNPQACEGI